MGCLLLAACDLSVSSIVDAPDPVTRGNEIDYTVTVAADGDGWSFLPAGVCLTITAATGTTIVDVSPACSHDGGHAYCSVGSLGAFDTASVNVTASTSAATPLGTATLTALTYDCTAGSPINFETSTANNTMTATTTVVASCGNGAVDPGEDCEPTDGPCCTASCTFVTAGTECRGAADVCDVAESCDGSTAACPADAVAAASTSCRAASDACDAAETCDGVGTACPADADAPAGTACAADGNDCTDDVCDGAGACTHGNSAAGTACTPDASVCTADTCDGAGVCTHAFPAAAGCVSAGAGKALLQVKTNADPTKDGFTWKWKSSTPVAQADFGAPPAATDLTLCVADAGGSLLFELTAPAGGTCGTKPCWGETGTGFKYKDAALDPDGVQTMVVKGGKIGGVTLKGKGALLAAPAPPYAPAPIRARLVRSDGPGCWESTHGTAIKNEGGQYKAKSD